MVWRWVAVDGGLWRMGGGWLADSGGWVAEGWRMGVGWVAGVTMHLYPKSWNSIAKSWNSIASMQDVSVAQFVVTAPAHALCDCGCVCMMCLCSGLPVNGRFLQSESMEAEVCEYQTTYPHECPLHACARPCLDKIK